MSMIDDEFFVISSDNLSSVENKLYGYAIVNNEILLKDVSDDLCGMGAYVQVHSGPEKIVISQDYMGSYGLYLYEFENFFAISNSFLKLEEYLRDNNHEMTLNMDYANYYMASNSSSHLPNVTLINEIRILPRNSEIILNKSENSIEIKRIDFEERTVSIKSDEGIEILDNWFYRWIDILRNVRRKTNYFKVDLTGGFDSRISMGLCLSANMDLNEIRINSNPSKKQEEDFEIASEIVDKFNLKLNNNLDYRKDILEFDDCVNLPEYIKGGFNKQQYLNRFRLKDYHYRISGHCGETIREYPHELPDEYIRNAIVHAKNLDVSLVRSTELLISNSFREIMDELGIEDPNAHAITNAFFNEGRNRIHFGKGFVNSYLFHTITLAPFSDPELHKLDYNEFEDTSILIHLIFKRFFPELIDIRFNTNKKLNEDTLAICDEINSSFPFKPLDYEFIPALPQEEVIHGKSFLEELNKHSSENLKKHEFMEDIFSSRKFEMDFKKYFSEDIYAKIRTNKHIKNHVPHGEVYAAVELIKIINDVQSIGLNQNFHENIVKNYSSKESNPSIKFKTESLLKKYSTARIDIKNKGSENGTLEILEVSDDSAIVDFPKWLNEGRGCVITSNASTLDFKVKIINDGNLSIKLRGVSFKDKLGNRFPVYIDYNKLRIDGEEIIKSNTLTSHDDSYLFESEVSDSQILDVHVEWLPVNADSEYVDRNLQRLKDDFKTVKDENRELKNKLNEIYNSRFWKLVSKLK